MDGEIWTDDIGHRFYTANVISGEGSVSVNLPVERVEQVVAMNTKIEPHLEGGMLYLRFHSPGDGFTKEWEEFGGYGVPLGELVDGFLAETPYLSPSEYVEALKDLSRQLKTAARKVGSTLQSLE